MSDDPINKSLPGMIAAAGLALASGSALTKVPKASIEAALPSSHKPWTPEGLDPEMHPIAHLESSWGKNMKHAAHPKGEFHTAFGACGLKPVTAHEQYMRTPSLQNLYPGLQKPEVFTSHLKEDPKLYNLTASAHWQWLRNKLGSPTKASYGWRWGAGAAQRTSEQIQKEDPYVQKFAEMSHQPLGKMSINDVSPGKKKKQFVWDYSHLLTPENKMAGYQINVSFHPSSIHPHLGKLRDRFHGEILHNGKPVGNLSAAIHTHCLAGPCIEPHVTIKDGHREKGLGTALYEGVFKEAKMAGIRSIHGHMQSEAAVGLHRKLAQRHKMGYRPGEPDGDSGHPHGEYKYLIKTEELDKVVLDSNAGYSIHHVVDDPDRIRVLATHNGKNVGALHLDRILDGATHISAFNTEVHPEHRRKGLASAMYVHAEKITGLKMRPSSILSHEGRMLWDRNEQFGKSEPLTPAAVVRQLLSSAEPTDWFTALKFPQATHEDIDFLMDRLATMDPKELPSNDFQSRPEYTFKNLSASKLWDTGRLHRAMTIPFFRDRSLTYAIADDHAADSTTIDRLIEDVDVWAPKRDLDPDDAVSGHPKGHDKYYRPDLSTILSSSNQLTPEQIDKTINLVHSEKLNQRGWNRQFFEYHEWNSKPIPPEFISKWMDMSVKGEDHRLMGHLSRHLGNEENFIKMMGLPVNYSNRGLDNLVRLSETQFKYLLMHPLSITSLSSTPGQWSDSDIQAQYIQDAIRKHLRESRHVSADMASSIIRHPNKKFISDLANSGILPAEAYRAIYEADPNHGIKFVDKTNCPEDIRTEIVKKHLNNGDVPYDLGSLRYGKTIGFNGDEEVESPISKEMTDLAVFHLNPDLLHAALSSPHLNTEHAQEIIKKGHSLSVIRAINDAEAYGDKPLDIDKGQVVKAITDRPQDNPARIHLAAFASHSKWGPYIGKEFYDSVVNNEMAEAMNPASTKTYRGKETINALLNRDSSAPVDFLHAALQLPFKEEALYHPNLPQATFDEQLPKHLESEPMDGDTLGSQSQRQARAMQRFLAEAQRPRSITDKHLDFARNKTITRKSGTDPEEDLYQLYASPAWSKERLDQIWDEDKIGANEDLRDRFLNHPNRSDRIVEEFMTHPTAYNDSRRVYQDRVKVLNSGLPKAALKRYADHFKNRAATVGDYSDGLLAYEAKKRAAVYEPDSVYRQPVLEDVASDSTITAFHDSLEKDVGAIQGHIKVRPGNQKLRKIRDLILEKAPEKGEIKPKDLPPGDWSAGRLPNGNISAKKLNEHIDAQEPVEYNFSHDSWTGSQRHSVDRTPAQKVFQVNLTNDMFDKLESAGVGDTFRKMVKLSQNSSHPIRPDHTLGWVRYDGDKDNGFHIDEIQSDFGQSFIKQAARQAAAGGYDANKAAESAEAEYPEEHYNKIKSILFKDKHPNEMLAESFHQYLRDQGHHNTPVHMLHAETKAPISGQDPAKPLPVHILHTYKEVPKKMAMVPKTYGSIPAQNNETHKGKPTWGDQVRKFEQKLAAWGREFGVEELSKAIEEGDFKGLARAVDPTGGSTVDHKPHLDAHPSHMTDEVNDYRANVLESPTRNKRLSSKNFEGITSKVVYKTTKPNGEENKYMCKPYHERVIRRVKDWQHKHAIGGWAEMANQGLYHAAGIGDLHQKVHVSEHPMRVGGQAKQEPALVVHLADGFKPVADHSFKEHDSDLHDSVVRLALMDHLTNNLDRHHLNLLVNHETRKVMAIDHSRSFSYKAARKPYYGWNAGLGEEGLVRPKEGEDDSLDNYIKGGAIAKVMPPPKRDDYKAHESYRNKFADVIENWWPKVSQAVKKELDKHLEQVKNPTLKEHIRRNFHARAEQLDEMANMGVANYGQTDWSETPVPMYKYGEGNL